MSFKVLFSRWLSPRRRPIDGDGKPTNLLVGELAFDPARDTFYAGTPTSTATLYTNIIPAPQIHLSRPSDDFPAVAVSYLPTANDSWLQKNPEVWLFAYRKRASNRAAGFVHPTDVSRADDGTAFYSGFTKIQNTNTTYHTEFPFVVGNVPPRPYQRVPLGAFNCLEFYWKAAGGIPTPADFPIIKTGTDSPISCPRMSGLRTRFQFRFAIDNPNLADPAFKLFGPPSPVVYCAPNYRGNYRLNGAGPDNNSNPRILGFRAFM